jgi:hypothetical protein
MWPGCDRRVRVRADRANPAAKAQQEADDSKRNDCLLFEFG